MNIQINRRDLIWSYIGVFWSLGSNALMIPLTMYYMDGNALGLWHVFQSLGSLAVLLDFGFSPAFARNIAYCWSGATTLSKTGGIKAESAGVDFVLMKKILTTSKRIYLIIATAALLLCLTFGTAYIAYLSKGLDGRYIPAWLMFCAAIFLNLYYGYFSAFLPGVGAIRQFNKVTVICRTIQLALTVTLFAAGYGIVAASIAYLLYSLILRILAKWALFRYHDIGKNLNTVQDCFSFKEMHELFQVIWHNTWRDGVVLISNYVAIQSGVILCSIYLTLSETATYSICVQLATAVATVAGTAYKSYQPSLQAAYITRDINKSKRAMSLIVVSFILLYILGMAGLMLLGLPILALIKSSISINAFVFFAIGIYQFWLNLRRCYLCYFSCSNRIYYLNTSVFTAILFLVLSILLLQVFQFGMWGLVGAHLISQLAYNLPKWISKVHTELQLGYWEMLRIGLSEMKALFSTSKRNEGI